MAREGVRRPRPGLARTTPMPELVVSSVAALEEKSAIALGNVVGSNIANLGLVLGLTALVSPPKVEGTLIRREVPVFVLTALLPPFLLIDAVISRIESLFLLAVGVLFTLWTLRGASATAAQDPLIAETFEEVTTRASHGGRLKLGGLAALGLALLVFAGKWFVDGATSLAIALGISERVVGLTIVAIGTSLPELASSIVAALRGHSALAVGNIVGSNIFNILFVLGGASLLHPIESSLHTLRVDLAVLVGFSLVGFVLLRGHRHVTRVEGSVLLGAYGVYLGFLAWAGWS